MTLIYVALWYLFGVASLLTACAVLSKQILMKDAVYCFVMGIIGPVSLIIFLGIWFFTYFDPDKVLWRKKSAALPERKKP